MGTTGYEFADHILDGKLAERLGSYRRAGVPYTAIARLLGEETGAVVNVRGETIRRWCDKHGIEAEPVRAAS